MIALSPGPYSFFVEYLFDSLFMGCTGASRMIQFSFCGLYNNLGAERLQVPLRLEGPDRKK